MAELRRRAARRRSSRRCIGTAHPLRARRNAADVASVLAPAGGLSLPSLKGIHRRYEGVDESGAATLLARSLILSGLAHPRHWHGDPVRFIKDTLDAWVAEHSPHGARWFSVYAMIADSLMRFADEGPDVDRAPNRFYLAAAAEPSETRAVAMGATLAELAAAHKSFPRTFYRWFVLGIGEVITWFDWASVIRHIEWLTEVGDDDAAMAIGDSASFFPKTMLHRHMSEAAVKAALRGKPERIRRLMSGARELWKAGEAVRQPKFDWPRDVHVDWMEPWPALLITNAEADATAGHFDEYGNDIYQNGGNLGPCFLLELNAANPAALRSSIESFWRACHVLELAANLLDMVEHPEGAPLVRVLV